MPFQSSGLAVSGVHKPTPLPNGLYLAKANSGCFSVQPQPQWGCDDACGTLRSSGEPRVSARDCAMGRRAIGDKVLRYPSRHFLLASARDCDIILGPCDVPILELCVQELLQLHCPVEVVVRAVEIGMHVVQQQCPTSVGHTARQCSNPRHCRGKKSGADPFALNTIECAPSPGADVRPSPGADVRPSPGTDVPPVPAQMCAKSRRRCAPSPGADVRPVPAQMCAQVPAQMCAQVPAQMCPQSRRRCAPSPGADVRPVPAQMWPRPRADVAQSRHAALVSPGESMRPSSVAARTVTAARRRDSVEAEPLDISVSLTSRWPLRPCRCATAQTDRSHRGRRGAALSAVLGVRRDRLTPVPVPAS